MAKFLITNVLFLIVGLAMGGYGIYLLVELGDFAGAFDEVPIVGPLIMAGAIIITALLGIVGERKNWKCFLVLYLVIMSVATITFIAAGVLVAILNGYLSKVGAGKVETDAIARINDFELVVFNTCCGSQASISEVTVECSSLSANSTDPCIQDIEFYNKIEGKFKEEVCEYLNEVEINDVPIVGNITGNAATCGGGDAKVFLDNLTEFIQSNFIIFAGITFGGAATCIGLVCSALCLIVKKREQDEIAKSQAQSQQVTGSALAN